jgi:outer membrane protein OmpA-like peptidoglycan-associated protein/Mg-chelatase subunit ChlD
MKFLLKNQSYKYLLVFFFLLVCISASFSQQKIEMKDSVKKAKDLLENSSVKSAQNEIQLTIRNVDITQFPLIKVIIEARNIFGQPLDTLYAENLTVLENGIEKRVQKVEKITMKERVPVDFVFAIDITGSMQVYIDGIKKNIVKFTKNLVNRGIDYRLGLILFTDMIENVYQPTDEVMTFLNWLAPVKAAGGGDEKENALEALDKAANLINYRPSANRVCVIITDAPYHQVGEHGDGTTKHNTASIIKLLVDKDVRVFPIVASVLKDYRQISQKTRGTFFDIDYPFSQILDNFSSQLTNLYALSYRTDEQAIPDSIDIAILNDKKELVRKTIPIVELGRKLIIENLLYETNSAALPGTVQELEVLAQFMTNKQNVKILVEGHTDNQGNNAINDALSLKRAETVKSYLMSKGIAANRIQTIGYGKRRPLMGNKTDFGKRLNRRTEIVIVAK